MKGKPVQIITSSFGSSSEENNDSSSHFTLKQDALGEVLAKVPEGMMVSVISVVGAFRTGKSFLLTLFLRYLRGDSSDQSCDWLFTDGSVTEGNNNSQQNGDDASTPDLDSFAWRGGHERMTTGIWMWSEPFIRKSKVADGEDIAVLLLDTQGMFDNVTTMELTAQIFGISTLVSSFQIYNVQNSIGEDKLQHLALFSEYGRLALDPSAADTKDDGGEDTKDDGGEDTKDDGGEDTKEEAKRDIGNSAARRDLPEQMREFHRDMTKNTSKPFQHLLFLVRDWANYATEWPEEKSKQAEALTLLNREMREYFAGVISYRASSDLQSTRNQISRCFETVASFLLPHPGPAVMKRSFNGDLKALDPCFLNLINTLVRRIFDAQIEPKRVHNRNITAQELGNFFDAYVKVFQSGGSKFPKAMTILEATAEANNRNAYDLSIGRYNARMTTALDSQGFVQHNEFHRIHDEACVEAWTLFKEVATMGDIAAIENTSVKLNDTIAAECSRYRELNTLRNPYRDFEKFFIPLAVAVVAWFASMVVHATCDAAICISAKQALSRIYMSILCILVVVFWAQIKGAIKNIKVLAGQLSEISTSGTMEERQKRD